MSYDDREAVVKMDDANIIMDGGDHPDDMDQAFDTLPPREEGFDISHAGGEHKVFEGAAEELGMYTFISFVL
jgi:hypothetical protein